MSHHNLNDLRGGGKLALLTVERFGYCVYGEYGCAKVVRDRAIWSHLEVAETDVRGYPLYDTSKFEAHFGSLDDQAQGRRILDRFETLSIEIAEKRG
jgi:hypothetical protein